PLSAPDDAEQQTTQFYRAPGQRYPARQSRSQQKIQPGCAGLLVAALRCQFPPGKFSQTWPPLICFGCTSGSQGLHGTHSKLLQRLWSGYEYAECSAD